MCLFHYYKSVPVVFHVHLLYQPHISRPCQATCVQSHKRRPRLAVAIATCEVQVSTADSPTVPTVGSGVLKPLWCRLTQILTLMSVNLSLHIPILFYWSLYWSLYNAVEAADILTPTTIIQDIAITAEVCTGATAIASASVGDVQS